MFGTGHQFGKNDVPFFVREEFGDDLSVHIQGGGGNGRLEFRNETYVVDIPVQGIESSQKTAADDGAEKGCSYKENYPGSSLVGIHIINLKRREGFGQVYFIFYSAYV